MDDILGGGWISDFLMGAGGAAEPRKKYKKKRKKERKEPQRDPEDQADEDMESWTDEQFFKVFPKYREQERKRKLEYIDAWATCSQLQVRRTSRVITRFFDQEIRDRVTDEVLRSGSSNAPSSRKIAASVP